MGKDTKQTIIDRMLKLLATEDPKQISMRQLAKSAGIQQSVLYHHFKNKSELIDEVFNSARQRIRQSLAELPSEKNARKLMRQRIHYHLTHGHLIVPMFRYFMAFKEERPNQPGTFIPAQAVYHIQQAIEAGVAAGLYTSKDVVADAKVIVHSLNGFVMENFPNEPEDLSLLIDQIQDFVERALGREEPPIATHH